MQDEVINRQLESVQSKLKEPSLRTSVLCDCVVRAMVCKLFQPVDHRPPDNLSFAHIHALELAQKGNIGEKKIGYLACCMLLDEESDLLLLLVNTIVRDLKSDNVIEINMALITAAQLIPPEMVPMIFPIVLQRSKHSKVHTQIWTHYSTETDFPCFYL